MLRIITLRAVMARSTWLESTIAQVITTLQVTRLQALMVREYIT
ncbi:MAG: hypothetical protein PHW01_00240 [Patescibacteria group bacterium]|nr:hypothetical protein [Patescibacteria group bacterium]